VMCNRCPTRNACCARNDRRLVEAVTTFHEIKTDMMKLFLAPRFFLAATLAVSFGSAGSVAAIPLVPTKAVATFRSSNWRVECGNNGTTLDCETTNRIVRSNGEPLAFITFHPAAQGGGANAVVQLPLGIALSVPVLMAIDGKSTVTLPVSSCVTQGCIASATLPSTFLGSARQGKTLLISFGAPDGREVAMSIALEGFGLAYDRLSR
jgi:invasion protein IalB